MKVAIHTLGCKLNQAESELLARQFAAAGHSVVSGEAADIHILNTCSVTHIADRKSRHLVRLWHKKNPEALIVATGCYAQRAPQELTQAGAGLVLGNEDKMRVMDFIQVPADLGASCPTTLLITSDVGRVRSFIKIQDGCNDSCAYCIVPQVRTMEYCLPMEEVVNEVKARVSSGYREIVLTGTKIGDYADNSVNLKGLVREILQVTGVERLHLSSLQPQDISRELLALWREHRLCRHFHLALQSGSGSVLKRMKRRYSLNDYSQAVSLIRNVVPDVSITTDVMVGFPGESVAEFKESYSFCKEMGFADMHVFVYSARPGTLAVRMSGQISDDVKRERSRRMLELTKESAGKFSRGFIGVDLAVLWENEVEPGSGVYSGLSHNYIRTYTESRQQLANRLMHVRPARLYRNGLWVELKYED